MKPPEGANPFLHHTAPCSASSRDRGQREESREKKKETREECYERAIEMVANIQSIPQYIPPPYTISYKCALGDAT